jgi:exopolyphosphatase / guanosine-5'-triphosphate,3'-diphosphate pyrophosphatase
VRVLRIALDDGSAVFHDPDATYTVPIGAATLAEMITADPPLPEELTNAVGLFIDHIEDVTREVPGAAFADTIEMHGPRLQALVDVFVGHSTGLPFDLERDDAEEIYRTLATEPAAARALNPGLPAAEVHHILGVACALVATLRALQVTAVTIVERTAAGGVVAT